MTYSDWVWESQWVQAAPGHDGVGSFAKRSSAMSSKGSRAFPFSSRSATVSCWLNGLMHTDGAWMRIEFTNVTISFNADAGGNITFNITGGATTLTFAPFSSYACEGVWRRYFARVWIDGGVLYAQVSKDGITWTDSQGVNISHELVHEAKDLNIRSLSNYNATYWMGIDDLVIST